MVDTLIGEFGCKNCRHAFRDGPQMVCRFNPPFGFPVPTPQGIGFASAFPPVQPDQCCAKHERGVVVGALASVAA